MIKEENTNLPVAIKIEKYRTINSARILISAFDLSLMYFMNIEHKSLIFTGIVHLSFACLWMFVIETEIFIEKKHFWSGYIPGFIDITAATIIIQMTGNIHSYLITGYFIITALTSMQKERGFGLFAAAVCSTEYCVAGVLVYFGILPNVNVFSEGKTQITIPAMIISGAWMFFGLFIVNNIVHRFVKKSLELTKKAQQEKEISERLLLNIKQELKFAKKIQSKLLPIEKYTSHALQIQSRYIPLVEVGGDLYDIIQISKDKVRVFLADATGHGVEAALITMLIKSELEGTKQLSLSPSKLLQSLNDTFYHKYYSLSFFFSCFVIDIDSKNNRITYASAGHPEQYLIEKENIIALEKTGKLIGVVGNEYYLEANLDFPPDSKLLLFTDGLFEEFNKVSEEFGEKRVLSILKENKENNMATILELLQKNLNEFLGENSYQDDITIIGIE